MSFKKLLLIGVLVAIAIYGVKVFKQTDQQAFHEVSKQRVEKLFENLKSGQSGDTQDAIGYWRVGHPEGTDQANLRAFERFLAEKRLATPIGRYEYVSSEVVGGDDTVNRFVRLNCKVDGRSLTMVIRHKEPIEWAD